MVSVRYDVARQHDFETVRANFDRAIRLGKNARFAENNTCFPQLSSPGHLKEKSGCNLAADGLQICSVVVSYKQFCSITNGTERPQILLISYVIVAGKSHNSFQSHVVELFGLCHLFFALLYFHL